MLMEPTIEENHSTFGTPVKLHRAEFMLQIGQKPVWDWDVFPDVYLPVGPAPGQVPNGSVSVCQITIP